jgi:hypothetical protein
MNYYFILLFKSFKVGIVFNLITLILAAIYLFSVETYFKPFKLKSLPIEFGTIVAGFRIYNTPDPNNYEVRPAWAKIQPKFDLFLPEFQLRPDWPNPSPRLEKWCKTRSCCAHRIGFDDRRITDFRCFTLDDWYLTNRDFLGSDFNTAAVAILDGFLSKLPSGSRVIVSEPYMLFADRRSFASFTRWVLELAAKYPALRFEIGIQIHLQWIDSYWGQYHSWLIPALGEFSRRHRIPWGISEFSIYDRLWKPRIAYGGVRPPRSLLIERIEGILPDRFRAAIVAHQAYLLHRAAVESGASFVVEWGNFPTTWFAAAIDPDYQSTFALFDWDGRSQLMYWAILRGLVDGKR